MRKYLFKQTALIYLFLIGNVLITAQDIKPIMLPVPQTEIGKPLMQVLKLRSSGRSFESKQLPIQELSNLLWAAYGINRAETGGRTAPSARNWQEIDIYVTLPEGVFIYDAKKHTLNQVSAEDLRGLTGIQGFVKTAPVNFIYVADMNKVTKDKVEYIQIWTGANCGFIAQNVYLYCASQSLVCVIRGLVDKVKLAAALKLRPEQKIMLCQTVGYGK
jgi:SagB-type dehydrogenase family enzyme